jgi:DNA-binding response OmpR family regulator
MGGIYKKILVSEDEKPLAHALELKLKSAGYEVMVAENGEMALDLLKQHTFDLVLLDLVMPKKDGFGVLTELQERGDKTPVIVSSNLSQEEDIKRAKSMGAVDFFIKSDTALVDIVKKVNTYLQN